MRAIVTGGCGFIGYNLCKHLEADAWRDWDVVVVDDLSSGVRSNVVPGFRYVYRSILTVGLLEQIVKDFHPDVIFHLAAVPRVSYSVEYPEETFLANVGGTIKVLEAVRKSKSQCRVINSSSSSIYGGADVLPTPENYPASPKSPYALEKWQAEEWCRTYAVLYDMDIVSLRYFNVTGPYSRYGGAYSTVLSAWLHSLFVDKNIKPFLEGDGTQSRDFCDVSNVIQANLLALQHKDRFIGNSFNVAQGSSYTLLQVKDLVQKIAGRSLDLETRPARVGDVKHTLADISAAKSVLGYNPTVDFEAQVARMADWYKS